jgi:hypothetical protein
MYGSFGSEVGDFPAPTCFFDNLMPVSATDAGVRDECHVNKSPLTFYNDGVIVAEGSQDMKLDRPRFA